MKDFYIDISNEILKLGLDSDEWEELNVDDIKVVMRKRTESMTKKLKEQKSKKTAKKKKKWFV